MAWHIRTATPADVGAVDRLLAASYPRLLKADYPPSILVTALPRIARAQPALLASGRYYLAETDTGLVIAAGGITPDRADPTLGHVRHVATDPDHVRRGIARALIDHAVRRAEAQGITRLEAWATRNAVPFYAALGFAEVGPMLVPLAPGIDFPSVRMIRNPGRRDDEKTL